VSFLDWFKPKSTTPDTNGSSATGQPERAQPLAPTQDLLTDAGLKAQRQERRERLYSVVREVMLRSEVLASRYKFKVLSLDTLGRQFLVMIDLLDAGALSPARFTEVELLIARSAAQQHALRVSSVYWRLSETTPAEFTAASLRPMEPPLVAALTPSSPVPVATRSDFDPISTDEVQAFKRAMSVTPARPAHLPPGQATSPQGTRPSPQTTGYEDTQLLPREDPASPLSQTQYGDL
jgi:hypothetical protein